MPIPIPIKSKPITVADIIKSVFSSTNLTLTSNCLCLASPLLLFHRHSYDPNTFAFPLSDKTDAVLFSSVDEPEYRFPS
jgi:hypothetical protein